MDIFMEKYLLNPDLPLINNNFKGNFIKHGKFSNYPWPDTDASLGNVLKWFLSPNPQKEEKKRDEFKLQVIKDPSIFDTQEDAVVWLGHSSFFIRIGGKNLLFDPVIKGLPLMKRHAEFPCEPDKIKNIDYILLSHGHRDHFDTASLKIIIEQNPLAKVLGPLKLCGLIRKFNKKVMVQEAAWYQEFNTENTLKITFLPALHWHRRSMTDFNEVSWGAFMIQTKNQKIFYAGDTAYGSHFKDIKNIMGVSDICLLPIGAYKPTFLMQASHMSPTDAIQAFKDLEGKKIIPMHYGTFDLSNEPLGEPIRILRKELNTNYLTELAVGEKFLL